jgi:hypothetical protein
VGRGNGGEKVVPGSGKIVYGSVECHRGAQEPGAPVKSEAFGGLRRRRGRGARADVTTAYSRAAPETRAQAVWERRQYGSAGSVGG